MGRGTFVVLEEVVAFPFGFGVLLGAGGAGVGLVGLGSPAGLDPSVVGVGGLGGAGPGDDFEFVEEDDISVETVAVDLVESLFLSGVGGTS